MGILVFAAIAITLWTLWVTVAVKTLRASLRGRRVGNALVCAACGYDLAGTIDIAPRCAECGSDLGVKGSVARGVRTRDLRSVIGSVTALVIAVAIVVCGRGTVLAVGSHLGTMIKPTGWLLNDLKSAGKARAGTEWQITDVLAWRWRHLGFSPSRVRGVIDAAGPWLRSNTRFGCQLTDYANDMLRRLPEGDREASDLFDAVMATMEADPTGSYTTWEGALNKLMSTPSTPDAARSRLADLVIARQAAVGGAINTSLSQRFQRDVARGVLGVDFMRRYMEASVDPVIVLDRDPPLLADDTIPVTIDLQTKETVIGTRVACTMRLVGVAANWPVAGSHVKPVVPGHQPLAEWSSCFQGTPHHALQAWVTLPTEPGEYELGVEIEFRVYELEERGSGYPVATSYADPARLGDLDQPKLHFVKTCSRKIVVRPSDAGPFEITPTEVKPEEVVKFNGRWGWPDVWASTRPGPVVVSVCLDPPPLTIAADVYLRGEGGDERKMGWLLVPQGESFGSRLSAMLPDFADKRARLVLRPAAGILRRPSSLGPVFDKELVLDETFVWRPDPKEWDDGGYYNWPER